MREDKRKQRYLVSYEEFQKKGKEEILAGFIAIFFGVFAAHRFYLGRIFSGAVLLVLSLSSSTYGNGIVFVLIVFVSLIEGVIYIFRPMKRYLNNKLQLFRAKEKTSTYPSDVSEKNKVKTQAISNNLNEFEEIRENGLIIKIFESKEHIKQSDIDRSDVIDVSKEKPSKVNWELGFEHRGKKTWVDKLDLPYERSVMKLNQIKDETLKMYEALCDAIDEDLRKRGKSLDQEVSRVQRTEFYYDNLLYTIYCIAEGTVTKAYSGSMYYDYDHSYHILEKHLGKEVKDIVFKVSSDLVKKLSPASESLIDYFNLTQNGLARVWWDENGLLREEIDFRPESVELLNITRSRNTVIWKSHEAKKQIILLYLSLWDVIAESLEKDFVWRKEEVGKLLALMDNRLTYYERSQYQELLSSLLKLSENAVRQVIPSMRLLNTQSEKKYLESFLPLEVMSLLEEKLFNFRNNMSEKILQEILYEMIEVRPDDWRLKLDLLSLLKKDESIEYVIKHQEQLSFIKEFVKRTEDEDLMLLSLSIIYLKEGLSSKKRRKLEEIIHRSQWERFEELLDKKEELSVERYNQILDMKNPLRKKIKIDPEKIEESKKELQELVEAVGAFIGTEEEEIDIEDTIEKNDCKKDHIGEKDIGEKSTLKYTSFLKDILQNKTMDLEKAKDIALDYGMLLNAFISDINRELYDYVQDQTLVVEDDKLKIDEFYIDIVRELVENEL